MNIEKLKDFINSGSYDFSKKKAYSQIFLNIGVALVSILIFIITELFASLIVFGAIFIGYLVIIFCINAKITEQNALTFLSHSITILMMVIATNFLLAAMLVDLNEFTLSIILISLTIQTIALIAFMIIIPIAVKSNHYQIYSTLTSVIAFIGITIISVVPGLVKFNSRAAEMKGVLIAGVFNDIIIIGFLYLFAQMLIKWYYCRKYNITVPNKNNRKTN